LFTNLAVNIGNCISHVTHRSG